MHRPLMNDPAHIALLDGQRYVVLRPVGAVREEYSRLQRKVMERLTGLQVSFPAHPHVTLLGLAKGTAVETVRELVAEWSPMAPPQRLEIESVGVFPSPFQIVIVRVRKTPDLVCALTSLRDLARQRGLPDLATIPPADWVFHLSVAYCSEVSSTAWARIVPWVETLAVPTAHCVVTKAYIAAFDGGKESSGGVVDLGGEGTT